MKENRIVPDIIKSCLATKDLFLEIKSNKTMAACTGAIKWIFVIRRQTYK